ncbi:MAG TPA: hypothetical protein VM912_09390 [Terriglobales bacterium]|nr:hypothetical protein [Terriglobales bacterium]
MVADLSVLIAGLFLGDLFYFSRAGSRAEQWVRQLANRKKLAVALCATLALVPRAMLLPVMPIPKPQIVDEFSYILGAETLAKGRLTNPVHPLWQHFESFHINMVPTYESQYQPAPSAFMALGLILGKSCWWGVWLATGLMCAAICWALQPLIGPAYALLAGVYSAFKYSIGSQYSDSYWGGSVCALGGALTLGALIRIIQTRSAKWAPWLVLGVGLLANSRPYEGFLFALPLALGLLVWVVRTHTYIRILAPTMALGVILVGWMAYFNYRGTGRPTEMPYTANFEQYHFVRPFFGMGMKPFPHYNNYEMAALFSAWEGTPGRLARTWSGIQKLEKTKFHFYYREHFAPLLTLALIGCFFCFRREQRSYLGFTFSAVLIGLFAVVWWPLSSYPAPLLVSFYGLAFLGIRYFGTARPRNYRLGRYWARGLAVAVLIVPLINIPHEIHKASKIRYPLQWNEDRERVMHQLEAQPDNALVLVSYAPMHDPAQEWVYNTPDIDSQKVIFARALGAEKDCDLVHYYDNRRIWFVRVGLGPWARLEPADSLVSYCNASPTLKATLTVPGELP